ncbi:mid1-interacting protein 1-like [Lutzomyia longipalpis]|uniref:mid1-interacting protein 1-like n=1 Tax=Lutzomyia longipalpis TaxID=7200 RepID=UPI00248342BD|nr:mid1-interacting protein 1-like [Lutzomyia longipalpis]
MNGYTDLTTNLENSRNCLRRIARHDDQEFSNQSIINVMEKFVKTVNAMDETILVPSRLMDRQVGDATDTVPVSPKAFHHGHIKSKKRDTVREYLNSADLLKLYNMLNLVKNDLLWARNDTTEETGKQEKSTGELSTNLVKDDASKGGDVAKEETEKVKGHVRRPSTISMSSSNSVSTLSDSESEISNENDSGIESESRRDLDKSQELAKQFRTHLLGLYRSLEQMTEAANYLTARYQSDVGPV